MELSRVYKTRCVLHVVVKQIVTSGLKSAVFVSNASQMLPPAPAQLSLTARLRPIRAGPERPAPRPLRAEHRRPGGGELLLRLSRGPSPSAPLSLCSRLRLDSAPTALRWRAAESWRRVCCAGAAACARCPPSGGPTCSRTAP